MSFLDFLIPLAAGAGNGVLAYDNYLKQQQAKEDEDALRGIFKEKQYTTTHKPAELGSLPSSPSSVAHALASLPHGSGNKGAPLMPPAKIGKTPMTQGASAKDLATRAAVPGLIGSMDESALRQQSPVVRQPSADVRVPVPGGIALSGGRYLYPMLSAQGRLAQYQSDRADDRLRKEQTFQLAQADQQNAYLTKTKEHEEEIKQRAAYGELVADHQINPQTEPFAPGQDYTGRLSSYTTGQAIDLKRDLARTAANATITAAGMRGAGSDVRYNLPWAGYYAQRIDDLTKPDQLTGKPHMTLPEAGAQIAQEYLAMHPGQIGDIPPELRPLAGSTPPATPGKQASGKGGGFVFHKPGQNFYEDVAGNAKGALAATGRVATPIGKAAESFANYITPGGLAGLDSAVASMGSPHTPAPSRSGGLGGLLAGPMANLAGGTSVLSPADLARGVLGSTAYAAEPNRAGSTGNGSRPVAALPPGTNLDVLTPEQRRRVTELLNDPTPESVPGEKQLVLNQLLLQFGAIGQRPPTSR